MDNKREDWVKLAKEVIQIEIDGLIEVKNNLGKEFEDAVRLIAQCKGRVVVTGVGKSGLIGRKIAATLSSTGTPSFFLHPVEGAHGDLGMIRNEDVVIAISYSGETDELNSILPTILSFGAKIIGLTGNKDSTLARYCHVVICTKVPKEACPLGLAPTASTTATLAVGDAIAVALVKWKSFSKDDFKRFHPGGELGRRLSLNIDKLMHKENLPVVTEGTDLKTSLEVMDRGGLGAVIITDHEGRLKGIFTDGDVRRMVCYKRFSFEDKIETYMTHRPRYATVGQQAAEILDLMEKSAITVVPVVDEELRLVGVVHLHDLLGKGKLKFGNLANL